MQRCLVDVNLLLPLVVRHHEHHRAALRWFDNLAPGEALICRFVQLAFIRLLGNRHVMADHAISAASAWSLLEELMEDERMELVPEPARLAVEFPKLLRYPTPANKLVADAYLAAFSLSAEIRLTTFDAGFQQFRGIDLELLSQ